MKYKSGYKYQLVEDLILYIPIVGYDIDIKFIKLTSYGELTLRDGYACDGPSGLTVDTKSSMRGAFVHDGLSQLARCGYLPQYLKLLFDYIAYNIWLEDGMYCWRANLWYLIIKDLDFYVSPDNKKKIYEAP